jgi:hypothetical protein
MKLALVFALKGVDDRYLKVESLDQKVQGRGLSLIGSCELAV